MAEIPDNYKLPIKEKMAFDPLPKDTYEVEITSLEFLPDQPNYNDPSVKEDKFKFEFTVLDDNTFTGADGKVLNTKGRKLWKEVRTTMNAGWGNGKASWLYRIFCAVYQCFLSEEETKSVEIASIKGMQGKRVRIVVQQKPGKKDPSIIYNEITDMLPSKTTSVGRADVNLTSELKDQPIDEEISVEDIPF